jgi:high-affinity K+ transport system ATPase subunit B
LWLTVVVANLAEAVAVCRGKAQAAAVSIRCRAAGALTASWCYRC